ncbi:phosphoenolpyruvate synthase [Patescibacteria group bacterium]
MTEKRLVVWFKDVDKSNIDLVGGKGANLGEMIKAGFPVPPGFNVTAEAYYYFIKENQLQDQIKAILKPVDVNDPNQLLDVSQNIRKIVIKGKVPSDLAKEIIKYYEKLSGVLKHCLVAVRSSATAEDLPDASFAGQQATFLNVKGEANLINYVRECWASLFTPRAIFYRVQKKFDHFKVGIAVPVQKMIQSDKSGVMFTLDPISNNKRIVVVEAIYGLGELIVQGSVTPDHFEVDKQSLKIKVKQVNNQKVQLIKSGSITKKTRVKNSLQEKQKITDKQVVELAKYGKKLHQHYFFPQDIEWAIEKGKIYILQTRPVTTTRMKKTKKKDVTINLPEICKGVSASPGIVSGYAKIIKSAREIGKVKKGEILITQMTTPDFVPAMKKAAAIVTDKGGQTSHAAIVSRELGLPCVVGTGNATKVIKSGTVITINGKTGLVYKGALDKRSSLKIDIPKDLATNINRSNIKIRTATKVYVNLGEPDLAEEVSKRNVDGVGLLRAEFMISESIGVHPRKLIKDKKQKLFIEKLSEGLKTFCTAFDPRPVVYRATDFKTNEYKNLKGGKQFEPEEANPMLGYRGAFRYIKDEAVFELELEAIKRVRNKYGLKNLQLMIPFVRTVDELVKVKRIIAANGLTRSSTFNLWMMVEVPSTVILLDDFIKAGIDAVSVGTNDLTMLILGVDRDSENVAEVYDERNKAVYWALEKIIKTCHKHKITCSICGQAPSVYPDLTRKLVNWGITSVSVSPDAIERTREIVYEAEKKRVR